MRTIDMADWKVTRGQKRLINKVLKSGRLTYGKVTQELEEEFAKLHKRKYGLFTNSGTSALKISLGALKLKHGWEDGDEVIVPAVTFVATVNAVVMNNLTPVLVDVLPKTVNIDPAEIEKAITKKTRAIIPVHLLGQVADMNVIDDIAEKHGLNIVEDSCETMFVGTAGEWGDTACFSSYIAHLMVTGVGGFILTDDKELATTMRSIMFHGRDESYLTIDDNSKENVFEKRFHFPRFGYSDRATELEAALGLEDLKNHEQMIAKRQDNAIYLMSKLIGVPITFPVVEPYRHAFMFFPMICGARDELEPYLEERGIRTRRMMPLTTQPIMKPYLKQDYPVAEMINQRGLLIGCHQYLKKRDLDYIVKTIRSFYEQDFRYR